MILEKNGWSWWLLNLQLRPLSCAIPRANNEWQNRVVLIFRPAKGRWVLGVGRLDIDRRMMTLDRTVVVVVGLDAFGGHRSSLRVELTACRTKGRPRSRMIGCSAVGIGLCDWTWCSRPTPWTRMTMIKRTRSKRTQSWRPPRCKAATEQPCRGRSDRWRRSGARRRPGVRPEWWPARGRADRPSGSRRRRSASGRGEHWCNPCKRRRTPAKASTLRSHPEAGRWPTCTSGRASKCRGWWSCFRPIPAARRPSGGGMFGRTSTGGTEWSNLVRASRCRRRLEPQSWPRRATARWRRMPGLRRGCRIRRNSSNSNNSRESNLRHLFAWDCFELRTRWCWYQILICHNSSCPLLRTLSKREIKQLRTCVVDPS